MPTAGAPTNNCIADLAFASNNGTITEILTLPFSLGGSSSSCSPETTGTIVDRLQQTMESIDLSFRIPNHPKLTLFGDYSIESNAVSGKYSVDLPNVQTLLDLQLGIAISVSIGMLFAAILYRTFLHKNDHKQNQQQQPSSSIHKTLIGSVLLITSILAPYAVIDAMGTKNSAVRFTICAPFFLYVFRILEAIFGFIPMGAKSSFGVYCTYFSLSFDMVFDENTHQPVKATNQDKLNSLIALAKAVTSMVILLSVLSPLGYKPFGETNAGEFHEGITLRDYLDARHLGNGFAIALFFQQALALGFEATASIIQTTLGYKVKQSMRNPMLEATSPSDFWSRRWNVLVHAVMKRGLYKPVRKYTYSPVAASLAVFVASGILHEWIVHAVIMYHRSQSHSSADVLLGSNTAFFVWNFVVIVVEKMLAGSKGIQSFGKMIPPVVVTFLIIMSALPMAHWFGNPYLNGGFFADFEDGFPLIRKVLA